MQWRGRRRRRISLVIHSTIFATHFCDGYKSRKTINYNRAYTCAVFEQFSVAVHIRLQWLRTAPINTHTHTHTHTVSERRRLTSYWACTKLCEFATKSEVSMMFTCNISLVTDHLSASLRPLQSDTAVSFSDLIGFYSVTALVAAFILCSLSQLAHICQRPVHTALNCNSVHTLKQ